LGPEFYFPNFSVFFSWEERGVTRFWCRERKLLLVTISSIKTIVFFFLSNSSLWWWEFILDFFSPRAIWAREDFGFQIDFEYWISCLHFWRSWIGLARFVACIISILGKKWLKMSLFFQKHPEPHYSSHYSGWILGILRRRVIYWCKWCIVFF